MDFAMGHAAETRACIGEFPSFDPQSPGFTKPEPPNSNPNGSQYPESTIDNHLAKCTTGSVVASDPTLSRFPIIGAMMEHGRFLDYFGRATKLLPLERLNAGDKTLLLFIIHGLQDSVVPVEGSEKFVQKVLEQDLKTKVQLSLYPGDHGLDIPFNLDHPWLADGLKLVIPSWLG